MWGNVLILQSEPIYVPLRYDDKANSGSETEEQTGGWLT